MNVRIPYVVVALIVLVAAFAQEARAHCDTLNGPVVSAARVALGTNDVTPVLKWVKPSEEAELRDAFQKATAIRGVSAAVREIADRFFFETVVRLHRLGEGEPYTGLKEATDIDVAVEGADRALQEGNADAVIRLVTDRVAAGIRERFARARELRVHADENVAAGRRYIDAYVDFIHFVEEVHAYGRPGDGDTHTPRHPGDR